MGQFLFWLIGLAMLVLFLRIPKVMNNFEIAACWMVSIVFLQDWVILAVIHLKQFQILDHSYWTIAMNRIFLFPAMTIIFLNYFIGARSLYKKFLWFIGWLGLALSGEYLNDLVGIFKHQNWPVGRSVIIWILLWVLLLIVRGLMAWLIRDSVQKAYQKVR